MRDPYEVRFAKDMQNAYVLAADDCIRDYVRNINPDRQSRKRHKNNDEDDESPSLLTITTAPTMKSSLSNLSSGDTSKPFQLERLASIRTDAQARCEAWKSESSDGIMGSFIKYGLVEQFYKDIEKYHALLRDNPLEMAHGWTTLKDSVKKRMKHCL